MTYRVGRLRQALVSKLGFREVRSTRHPVFERIHAGQVVAVTHISHGSTGKDVSDFVVGRMARQLGVRGPDFRGAIDCSLSPEEFLPLLLPDRQA